MIRFFATLSLALLAAGAQAANLDLGNVAPGAGNVRLSIGGTDGAVGLGYLEFERVQREPGPLQVTALGADDRVLAQASFAFAPTAGVDPMLVLSGNGSGETPFALRLYDGGTATGGTPAKADVSVSVALHHLAPFAGATTATDFEAVATCPNSDANGGSGSFGSRVTRYGEGFTQAGFSSDGSMTCQLKTAHPAFGSFDLQVPVAGGTLRFLLVGDGAHEPSRVLVMANGTVNLVSGESTPAVGAVLRSTAFWFDLARPAQGVSLYELPASNDVFGTWFTHDEAGQPVWYLLNGVATGVPGQRDLIVQAPTRAGGSGQARMATSGTARLFYIDCNQAELRVRLGREYYTLRLQRSREVVGCDALD